MARGKTIEQAGRYSLREAAEVVSKALKRAQLGNGSITAQGLRKWVLQGYSPYDWDMAKCFGGDARFPVDLDRQKVDSWVDKLVLWYGWKNGTLKAPSLYGIEPGPLLALARGFQRDEKPTGRKSFDGWLWALVAYVERLWQAEQIKKSMTAEGGNQ